MKNKTGIIILGLIIVGAIYCGISLYLDTCTIWTQVGRDGTKAIMECVR